MSGRAGIVYRASGAAGAWMGPFSDSDALYPTANARGRRFWGRVGCGLAIWVRNGMILVFGKAVRRRHPGMHTATTTNDGWPALSRSSVALWFRFKRRVGRLGAA